MYCYLCSYSVLLLFKKCVYRVFVLCLCRVTVRIDKNCASEISIGIEFVKSINHQMSKIVHSTSSQPTLTNQPTAKED